MADSERDVLDADEIAELRAAPMLVHTYDAHRLVRLLAAAQPSAEPGLDVAWAEAEALTGGVGSIKVQRWAWNVPHPFMVQYRNDDYVGATPTDALRALAAALTPDRPTPGPVGETGLQCLCGTDAALAAGETIYARLDIVCPKHDQGFGRL